MHCPLFSRAWGPKVGIKIYEIYDFSLAIALKLLTVKSIKYSSTHNSL